MTQSLLLPIGKKAVFPIEGTDERKLSVVPNLTASTNAPGVATATLEQTPSIPAVPAVAATATSPAKPAVPAAPSRLALTIRSVSVGPAKITVTGDVKGHPAAFEWDVTVTAAQPELIVHPPVISDI